LYTALADRSLRQASKRETTGHASTIERFLSVSVESTVSEVMNVLPGQTSVKEVQGYQNVSVHLMITTQKVTSNVQSAPHKSPNVY